MRGPGLVVSLLLSSAALAACSSAADFPDAIDDAGVGGGADGGGPGAADARPQAPTALPMIVDDFYAPSGYMGDGEHPGAITHAEICVDARPAAWVGRCHRFVWTPNVEKWGGVYWQYPDGNWGDKPGLELPAGATKVAFEAWGGHGGEVVSFMVGMMAVDGFELKLDKVVLGPTPKSYEIPLGSTSYGKVVGAFGWVAGDSAAAVTLHLDNVRWE